MPREISFAETTPALIALAKDSTVRDWKPHYAQAFEEGEELVALSKLRRAGGKPVGRIRLTHKPVLISVCDLGDEFWNREGFEYLTAHGLRLMGGQKPIDVWNYWKSRPPEFKRWLIQFEVIQIGELPRFWMEEEK